MPTKTQANTNTLILTWAEHITVQLRLWEMWKNINTMWQDKKNVHRHPSGTSNAQPLILSSSHLCLGSVWVQTKQVRDTAHDDHLYVSSCDQMLSGGDTLLFPPILELSCCLAVSPRDLDRHVLYLWGESTYVRVEKTRLPHGSVCRWAGKAISHLQVSFCLFLFLPRGERSWSAGV